MNKKVVYSFMLLLLLAGCSGEKEVKKPVDEGEQSTNEAPVVPIVEETSAIDFKLPIQFNNSGYNRLIDYLDEGNLLYLTDYRDYSVIQSYDLEDGNHEEIYVSNYNVGQVIINEQHTTILVISYPSSVEALFTFIDLSGKVLYEKVYKAFDFEITWNPYNEFELLIISFYEDWSYDIEVLNVKEDTTSVLTAEQPFLYWAGKEKIAYIDFSENEWGMTGDLVIHNIKDNEEEIILSDVYYIDSENNQLLAVVIDEDNLGTATYNLLNDKQEVIFSVDVPQLSSYADWYVPDYDFLDEDRLLTFVPKSSGMLDEYEQPFELIIFDKNGSEFILEQNNSLPLIISPDGQSVLFGYEHEKMILLNTKEIKELF